LSWRATLRLVDVNEGEFQSFHIVLSPEPIEPFHGSPYQIRAASK
jgi:hypothetical protein